MFTSKAPVLFLSELTDIDQNRLSNDRQATYTNTEDWLMMAYSFWCDHKLVVKEIMRLTAERLRSYYV